MICQVRSVWLLKCVPSESQSSGREQPHFLYLQNYGDTGMMCEDSSSACYGQSVCEAKISPEEHSQETCQKRVAIGGERYDHGAKSQHTCFNVLRFNHKFGPPTSRYEAKNIPNM